jgi:hypothetical protein
MNIESIKNRAREVLALNKVAYMRVLVIVLLINCIPSLFTATNCFNHPIYISYYLYTSITWNYCFITKNG